LVVGLIKLMKMNEVIGVIALFFGSCQPKTSLPSSILSAEA